MLRASRNILRTIKISQRSTLHRAKSIGSETNPGIESGVNAFDSASDGFVGLSGGFDRSAESMKLIGSEMKKLSGTVKELGASLVKVNKDHLPKIDELNDRVDSAMERASSIQNEVDSVEKKIEDHEKKLFRQKLSVAGIMVLIAVISYAIKKLQDKAADLPVSVSEKITKEIDTRINAEFERANWQVSSDLSVSEKITKEIDRRIKAEFQGAIWQISSEKERLQAKYNNSLSGSVFAGFISRGPAHLKKINALEKLRLDLIAIKKGKKEAISLETKNALEGAYSFWFSPEKEDQEFKEDFVSKILSA